MENMENMELEKAQAWLERAEETLYDAEMEFNNAAKGKAKKEAKEVFEWAKKQLMDASDAVLMAEIKPEESEEKIVVE